MENAFDAMYRIVTAAILNNVLSAMMVISYKEVCVKSVVKGAWNALNPIWLNVLNASWVVIFILSIVVASFVQNIVLLAIHLTLA